MFLLAFSAYSYNRSAGQHTPRTDDAGTCPSRRRRRRRITAGPHCWAAASLLPPPLAIRSRRPRLPSPPTSPPKPRSLKRSARPDRRGEVGVPAIFAKPPLIQPRLNRDAHSAAAPVAVPLPLKPLSRPQWHDPLSRATRGARKTVWRTRGTNSHCRWQGRPAAALAPLAA